jgi:hypothetical protein
MADDNDRARLRLGRVQGGGCHDHPENGDPASQY